MIGVDRSAGADHRAPPARLAGNRMLFRYELVASERMADEDDVGLIRVERTVGLIGERKSAQFGPGSSRSGRPRPRTTRCPGSTNSSPEAE